jgi:hypothetical protein
MQSVNKTSEALSRRVRSEFLEMPGLKLTLRQAARLWGLEENRCQAVIEDLMRSKFLARTSDGAIVRRSEAA